MWATFFLEDIYEIDQILLERGTERSEMRHMEICFSFYTFGIVFFGGGVYYLHGIFSLKLANQSINR